MNSKKVSILGKKFPKDFNLSDDFKFFCGKKVLSSTFFENLVSARFQSARIVSNAARYVVSSKMLHKTYTNLT